MSNFNDQYSARKKAYDGGSYPFSGSPEDIESSAKGNPFSSLEHRHTWERAIVQEVYPDKYTCDVYTVNGKFLSGVPWPEGGKKAPKRGDSYAVHFQMGNPVIERLDSEAKYETPPSESHSIGPTSNYGGESNFYANKGEGSQRGNRPRDVLPGDWLEVGSMGNMLGVLEGGTTVMKASDIAQIIATQAKHMLRLIGKNVKIDTGGGTLDFKTRDGKSTINLYTGADEETESNPSAENFRIRCELGADGEMVDFRVTDTDGRSVYRIHVDPEGRVRKKAKRETYIVEDDKKVEVGENLKETIGGDKREEIDGAKEVVSGGNSKEEVGGDKRIYAAKDVAINSMEKLILNSARNIEANASGSITDSSDPAFSIDVVNGDLKIDVGNIASGDAQMGRSGIEVDTFTGDIEFNSALGNFEVNTNIPGSVRLGGPGPKMFSGLLFELFHSFMEVFGAMIDSHVHPIPPLFGVPTGPPVVQPWNNSRSLFIQSKSRFVKMGG